MRRDPEGSRPRRGKPKAVENGRRQFYGLAYRLRTGTLFPPALFSLSPSPLLPLLGRFPKHRTLSSPMPSILSLLARTLARPSPSHHICPGAYALRTPASRHARTDPIAKLYLYPFHRVYSSRPYKRLMPIDYVRRFTAIALLFRNGAACVRRACPIRYILKESPRLLGAKL